MNAATQRRLTPVFGGAVVVLGLVLLALLFGLGRGVTWWDPPRPPAPLPAARAVTLPAPPPLQMYAPVWEHPLFSADRKPIVTSGGSEGVSLGDLQLTGIILTPNLHIALLGPVNSKGGDEDKQVSVREGSTLPDSSWKLIQVLPRSAIFASPSGRTELKLPAGAPIDQMSAPGGMQAPAPANNPMPATPPGREHVMEPAPPPPPPNDAQAQRLQKLRAAILKQRSQQQNGNDQGVH